jgi:prepilin-type N-terminal cleavage/methylation domain-containing protein
MLFCKTKTKFKTQGFTLVELLVVIAIIAILVTIATLAVRSARVKARDTKCIYDVVQIGKALDMYYYEEGKYPTDSDLENVDGNLTNVEVLSPSGEIYMHQVPEAPIPMGLCNESNNDYQYTALNPSCVVVSFCDSEKGITILPVGKCEGFDFTGYSGSVLTPGGIIPASSSGVSTSGGSGGSTGESDTIIPRCLADYDCNDDNLCTDDRCMAGSACENISRFDDGTFCNGEETCNSEGGRVPGSSPCDGRFCNEDLNLCVDCLVAENCETGYYCDDLGTCAECRLLNYHPENGALLTLGDEFTNYLSVSRPEGCFTSGDPLTWNVTNIDYGLTSSVTSLSPVPYTKITFNEYVLPEGVSDELFSSGSTYTWQAGIPGLGGGLVFSDSWEFTIACETGDDCDDGSTCTDDICEAGYCRHESTCSSGHCYEGDCLECAEDIHCDDANSCTHDICRAGFCVNDIVTSGEACLGEVGICDSYHECVECLSNSDCHDLGEGCDLASNTCKIQCGTIINGSSDGTIDLASDYSCNNTHLFQITNSTNLIIDCHGKSITCLNIADPYYCTTDGIIIGNSSDISLKNCVVNNFRNGIRAYSISDCSIENSTICGNRVKNVYIIGDSSEMSGINNTCDRSSGFTCDYSCP